MVCYFQIIQVRLFSNDWLQLTVARGYSQINWVGCEARFPKSLPYLRPNSAIFPTLFMTWPKMRYPIYDLTLKYIPSFRPALGPSYMVPGARDNPPPEASLSNVYI